MPKNERRNITYVDPLFHRPPNVKDMSTGIPESSGGMIITGNGMAVPNVSVPSGTANWVTRMQIIEQIMKANPDGTHSVDVIVDVNDIPGAINFNIRITLKTP